jgi:hypothetical protein
MADREDARVLDFIFPNKREMESRRKEYGNNTDCQQRRIQLCGTLVVLASSQEPIKLRVCSLAPNPCSEYFTPPAKKHIPKTSTDRRRRLIYINASQTGGGAYEGCLRWNQPLWGSAISINDDYNTIEKVPVTERDRSLDMNQAHGE